jgi:hypothetical protein
MSCSLGAVAVDTDWVDTGIVSMVRSVEPNAKLVAKIATKAVNVFICIFRPLLMSLIGKLYWYFGYLVIGNLPTPKRDCSDTAQSV